MSGNPGYFDRLIEETQMYLWNVAMIHYGDRNFEDHFKTNKKVSVINKDCLVVATEFKYTDHAEGAGSHIFVPEGSVVGNRSVEYNYCCRKIHLDTPGVTDYKIDRKFVDFLIGEVEPHGLPMGLVLADPDHIIQLIKLGDPRNCEDFKDVGVLDYVYKAGEPDSVMDEIRVYYPQIMKRVNGSSVLGLN